MRSHIQHVLVGGLLLHGSLGAHASDFPANESGLPPLEQAQQVLATKVVRVGNDTFAYKRVSPPSPKVVVFKDEPLPPVATNLVTDWEPTKEEISFTYSVIPYPSGVSEIQWMGEDGRQKRVFVHEDLAYLEFSFGVAVDGNHYNFCAFNYGAFAGVSLQDYPAQIQDYVRGVKNLPVGQFIAVSAAGDLFAPLTEAEVDAIEVMLSYYQVNRAILKAAHEEALARWAVEVEAKRIRDLTPKAIEIRLWPVTSQRYSTAK